MKSKTLKHRITFLTPICVSLLAFASPMQADGSKDGDRDRDHKEDSSHDRDDHKHAKAMAANVVKLEVRTLLAPPVAGAETAPSGAAALEAKVADGIADAELKVRTRGLAADTYTVAVTKKSDGSSVVVGTFTINPVVTPVVGRSHHKESSRKQGSIEFETDGKNPLPADFDGLDVATISLSDSLGNIVLTGDLTTRVERITRLTLTPGATAPTASGAVSVFTKTRSGVTTSKFTLVAKGLPVSADLTLAINGVDVQTATTSTAGRLRIRDLPETVDISAVTSVEIHDATPTTLLSGSL